MRQRRFIIVLGLALVFGTLAGVLALRFRSERATPLMATEAPRGQIVVAVNDLSVGTVIRAEDVRAIDWHSNVLPTGYYATPAEVIGRGVITPVAINEPLLAQKLADKESGGGLPILVTEGMRGLTVRVDEVIGVAGFVLPNTRVDVLLTVTPREGNNEAFTRIILENVQVLASGQTIEQDANGTPITVSVVTLLLSPTDAEKLTLATNDGRIQLALRNPLDLTNAQTQGIRSSALVSAPRPNTGTNAVRVSAPAPRDESTSSVVEIIRGGERTLNTFQSRP
jgi:pilus assembly protein CpaB